MHFAHSFIALTASALLAVAPASAPITAPVPVHMIGVALDPELVHEYLLQATKFSRYPMPTVQPVVDVVPDATWRREVCGPINLDCIATSLGYYGTRRPDDVNVVHVRLGTERPVGGIIVHELIHWLQRHYGWGFGPDCQDIAAHEVEAYAVEYMRDTWAGIRRSLDIPKSTRNASQHRRQLHHEQFSTDARPQGSGPGHQGREVQVGRGRSRQEQGRQESGEAGQSRQVDPR